MPSRRGKQDLILFSSDDPRPLVEWLCDNYGLQAILQEVARYRPSAAEEAPAKRAYKKRGAKKGGAKKASKKTAAKRSGKKGRKGSGTAGETAS